eukprot:1032830_1
MSQLEHRVTLEDMSWLYWKQAIIHKHRVKFFALVIMINLVYPIILMSFCWNITDCANIIDYRIYLIANPFIYVLWFVLYVQMINICCGPSPLRRYSKCLFVVHSILCNWLLTIGLWLILGYIFAFKMIYIASTHPNACENTSASVHLFIGYLLILIANTALLYLVSKEQFMHLRLIYTSNTLTLPWNTGQQSNENVNPDIEAQHDDDDDGGYHEPPLSEPISLEAHANPMEVTEPRTTTNYNFFGRATFETYFNGISTVLEHDLTEDKECSICIDDMCQGDQTVILVCTHKFHEKCIVEWLKLHQDCSCCR